MESDFYIYGKHAVVEALRSPRKVLERVLISPTRKDDDLRKTLKIANVPFAELSLARLPRGIDQDDVHQGVVGIVSTTKLVREYETFMQGLTVTPDTCFALLGELQDPHNVGAVIRSAAAFGLAGVIIPEHNQVQVTATVIKVSAGMAFTIPLISVGNVNQTARDLKDRGFWIYGLDGEATTSIDDEAFDRPTVFVLGNEGSGLREKTKEVCDIMLKIPLHPRAESLNVSASAAVAFHAWSRGHRAALSPE